MKHEEEWKKAKRLCRLSNKVILDTKPLQLVAEITGRKRSNPIFQRPDGSITNW